MNKILERIDKAAHVVVISHIDPDADSISSASAMYTHLLRLHKKVSFFCATKDINQKLSFLPWFDKIRNSFPSSADLAISLDCSNQSKLGVELDCDLINIGQHIDNNCFGQFSLVDTSSISSTQLLYRFFKENNIGINQKMATALYAGVLDRSNGFMNDEVDKNIFLLINELIEYGADYKLCNKFIMKHTSLGAFRLKAIMYKNMLLIYEARIAVFCVSDEDMKSSGAISDDCEEALEESLHLPSVEVAVLFKYSNDMSMKCSLQSCSYVDVLKIAQMFDGTGCSKRADFYISSISSLEELKDIITKLIHKEL